MAAEAAAAGPVPFPNYTAPNRNTHNPNPGATAVPLSGGMRAPWEPTRGHSNMWNNKEAEVEAVRKDIERVEIRAKESPYFKESEGRTAEVITIDDDDDDENEVQVKGTKEAKKLSLTDYKNRQMKIFDYVDSPSQHPREIPSSPTFKSPVRPRRSIKKNVVTPRKSLSNPVGQIIANHIQNTPKKKSEYSDDEVEDDLESSRYDNLNKPPCLDESEDEDDYYDGQEEQEADEEHEQESKEEQAADVDDDEEEEEEEEEEEVVEVVEVEEKVNDLEGLVKSLKFNSPHSSDQAANQQIEKTAEINRRPPLEPKNLLAEKLKSQTTESEIRTPNLHQLDPRQQDQSKSRPTKEEQSKRSSKVDKENKQPASSKSSNSGFYRLQS